MSRFAVGGQLGRWLGAAFGAVIIAGALVATAQAADAAPGDIGYEGPSFAGMDAPATNEKPQSKLWHNDGIWWADLFDSVDGRHEIWRLDVGTQTWTSTNVALDSRPGSHTDILWDGSKLYVASNIFRSAPSSGTPSYFYRYGYNASTDQYSLDAGFPSQINNLQTETLVIDKDSTGKLWTTWTQGNPRQVYVSTSGNGGASWGAPFPLAVGDAATTDNDDISSLIAFGGNKIGLMWSNQRLDTMYFSVHSDGAPDATWATPEPAYSGPGRADDHINMKTDGSGRIFAATKTSADPLNMLLRRDVDGTWSAGAFGTSSNDHTRPIVVLDTAAQVAHMFATCPQPPASGAGSGGDICEKTSPMNGTISFASGIGSPVIRWLADGDLNRRNMNNATSTKQNVSGTTGLVVLASIGYTTHYWHHYAALGGGGGPVAPVANFAANPTSGTEPLTVNFTDTSTNTPTQWAWDFQNNGTVDSTVKNPSFTYTTPGTYTVKLTASNGSGSDVEIKTSLITVNEGSTPTEYQAFVARSYGDLLQRGPDSPSFNTWVSQLQGGMPRASYTSALLGSGEFRGLIVREFFELYLERQPDPAGLAAFAALIDGGHGWERAQSSILGSHEFFANAGSDNTDFLAAVYAVVLNRGPDAPGGAFFLQKLNEGWSRQMVAEAIVLSPEARSIRIKSSYDSLLGRPVDGGSLNVWLVTPYESVLIAIIASDEYLNLPA